jgi:tetratricopeptide (TPR) repeat protein
MANMDVETFQDRIGSLFEELELAIKWDRPSILVAVYDSELVRKDAELALEKKLKLAGQFVHYFRVSEKQFDIPLLISGYENRETSVFFISGLRWGGGKGSFNAFRALNLRREYFVDNCVRAVFWLTKTEANDLPHRAPDFWAFRHRVIEFVEQPETTANQSSTEELSWGAPTSSKGSEDIAAKIVFREDQLSALPQNRESQVTRAGLLYDLAGMYWKKGDYKKTVSLLKQGLDIATLLGDRNLQSRFWLGLGSSSYNLGHKESAVTAYQTAIALNPQDALAWSNLAIVFRDLGRPGDADRACQNAIALDPKDSGAWNNLGNVYRDLGKLYDAREAYLKAVKFDPENAGAWNNLGSVYSELGRSNEAIRAFLKATRRNPKDPVPLKKLAGIYMGLGRFRDASKAYEAAIKLDPEDVVSQASLKLCYQKLN